MTLTRRTILATGFALMCQSALAQTVPAGYPADYENIIKGASKEGTLMIYTNMEAVQWEGAIQIAKKLAPGLNIKLLEINSGEIASRWAAESGSGMPSADLLVTTDVASWVNMANKDQIMPYQSPEAAIYPSWSKPHPGLYTIAADPMMFMWNKALLPADMVPNSFQDLAEKVKQRPDLFKGMLTTYNAETPYGYNAHYAFVRHHGEKGWDWLKTLAPMTRPDGTGPMIEKITTGEYTLSYFMGAGAARLALKNPARAKLLGLKPISDGNPVVLRGVAAPKTAAHPNAAKLMIDVLLSKAGQISLGLRARTPIRPDVTSADVNGELTFADVIKEIGEDKLIPITFDADLASNTTFENFVKRYRTLTGK